MITFQSKDGLRLVKRAAICLAVAGCLMTANSASAQFPRNSRGIPRATLNKNIRGQKTAQPSRRRPGLGLAGRVPTQANQGADLVVQQFKQTSTPQFKNGSWEIPVSFKVVNQGNASTGEQFVNGVLYGSNYRWSGFMSALGPGASETSSGIVKIPDAPKKLAGATLNLVAYADAPIAGADTSMPSYGRINETNDSNNQASLSVKLPGGFGITGSTTNAPSNPPRTSVYVPRPQIKTAPQNRRRPGLGFAGRVPTQASQGPDLVVQQFKRTGAPQFKNGSWEIPVSFKVVNQGNASTGEQFVNGVLYGSNYRWSGFMSALAPGASKTSSGTVKIPDAPKKLAGATLNLVAYADAPIAGADTSMPAYGRINETNDSNNQASLSVELPGGFGITGSTTNAPTNPPRFPVAVPEASFVPQNRPATRPTRVPTARPGRPAPIGQADLVIRSIRFVPSRPQMAYVTVGNAGQGPARASVLRLTVRQIHGTSVGRTMDVRVPALQPAESKVLTVDASKILPNNIRLQVTTFRVDADATKTVAESDETNNLEWHMP